MRSHLAVAIAVSVLITVCAAAGTPEQPLQAPLPPELPWAGDSRDLIVPRGDRWITPAEESGMLNSPGYDETVAWLKRLVGEAAQLKMTSIGAGYEGRDIHMVIASAEGYGTAAELKEGGKPTLLVQAGIHSGEIDGKDAGMMLLRDMTVRGTKKELLEKVNLLFVPILSVDGHERSSRFSRMNQRGPEIMGWRSNARNMNLNRDYAKLDTPEIRAVVGVMNDWPVDLYIDVHVTDGADYQYDVTYGWNGPHAYSPAIARWLDSVLRPRVDADLTARGHIPGPLIFQVDRKDPSGGIWGWTAGARFSGGYADIRHLPSILVENHSLKPFEQRVLGTHVFLEGVMRLLGEKGGELRQAVASDSARREAQVPLGFKVAEKERPTMEYRAVLSKTEQSEITGDEVVRWTGEKKTLQVPQVVADTPAATAVRPVAYWIPPAWPEVIERLELHGVQMQRLEEPRELTLEMYRLEDAKLADTAYEGHVRVSARPAPFDTAMVYPPGSVRVPSDQPLGDLAVLLLEPASPDSFLQWGFFLEVLTRTEYFERYAMEPLAVKMLEGDPKLRDRFKAKLESDEPFRNDPAARLEWFYRQTPYYDQRHLLYPVGREM